MSTASQRLSRLPLSEIDKKELVSFCDPDANRFAVLTQSLERRNIPFEVIPLNSSKHIALPVPNPSGLDGEYYRVTLVAHYDRVPGTPGANDNSAAVFQLLSHWEDMQQSGWKHRTQILFTDGEELTGEMRATDQGSWQLARHLNRLGAKNILFLVLDMCGIGDTPVWGRSLYKAGLLPGAGAVSRAHQAMESFLLRYTDGTDYGVNPMFSDDLGLLLGGYPALQLSLLPKREAEKLAERFAGQSLDTDPEAPARYRTELSKDLPPSWQSNHSADDSLETLDPKSFRLMAQLLRDLARFRFPLS